jgi:hypothetical protein
MYRNELLPSAVFSFYVRGSRSSSCAPRQQWHVKSPATATETASTRSINQSTRLAVVEPRRLPKSPSRVSIPRRRRPQISAPLLCCESRPVRGPDHATVAAPVATRPRGPHRIGSDRSPTPAPKSRIPYPLLCPAHHTPRPSQRRHTRPHPCSRCRLFSGSLARHRGGKTENGPSHPAHSSRPTRT